MQKTGIIRLDLRRGSLTDFPAQPVVAEEPPMPIEALPDEGRRALKPRIITRRHGTPQMSHSSRFAQKGIRSFC